MNALRSPSDDATYLENASFTPIGAAPWKNARVWRDRPLRDARPARIASQGAHPMHHRARRKQALPDPLPRQRYTMESWCDHMRSIGIGPDRTAFGP
jgi:hypothetical protein